MSIDWIAIDAVTMPGKNILFYMTTFPPYDTPQVFTQLWDVEILMCQPLCSIGEFYKDSCTLIFTF